MSIILQRINSSYFQQLENDVICNLGESMEYYPKFNLWIRKVQSEIQKNNRICLGIFEENNIVGLSIIKNGLFKSKICTLWVHNDFRRKGLGNILFNQSMLACKYPPIITVPQYAQFSVVKCIQKHQPKLLLAFKNKYVQGEVEYIYKIPKRR